MSNIDDEITLALLPNSTPLTPLVIDGVTRVTTPVDSLDLVTSYLESLDPINGISLYTKLTHFEVKSPFAALTKKPDIIAYVSTYVRGEFLKFGFAIPDGTPNEDIIGLFRVAVRQFEDMIYKPQDELRRNLS